MKACAAPIWTPTTSCGRHPGRSGGQADQYQGQHAGLRDGGAGEGATVEVTVAAKGGGSEAKAKFVMLDPSDSVVDGC